MLNPLAADLDYILTHTKGLWEEIRGKRLFITGGTGFIGCWLLESFAWANEKLDLKSSALVLARDYAAFHRKAPNLAKHSSIRFHTGDIRNFSFPAGEFSHILHAAAAARTSLNDENQLLVFETIVGGTRHTLDFAKQCGARKFLLTSSGAVYGKQPPNISHITEEYPVTTDLHDPRSAYSVGKMAAEHLCALYARNTGIETKIARCFTFVGPYLPLNINYAVGNFIHDGLRGGPVQVKGDGTPYRSYLYAADLTIWLWSILFNGKSCVPYNVGSEEPITIADLAKTVARSFPFPMEVNIAKKTVNGMSPEMYIPSTKKVREDCGVRQIVTLQEGIKRTIDQYLVVPEILSTY